MTIGANVYQAVAYICHTLKKIASYVIDIANVCPKCRLYFFLAKVISTSFPQ